MIREGKEYNIKGMKTIRGMLRIIEIIMKKLQRSSEMDKFRSWSGVKLLLVTSVEYKTKNYFQLI